jgi:hypothetical protein
LNDNLMINKIKGYKHLSKRYQISLWYYICR